MEVEKLRLEVLKIAAESQKSGEPRHILAAAKEFEAYIQLGLKDLEDETVKIVKSTKKRRGRPPKRK